MASSSSAREQAAAENEREALAFGERLRELRQSLNLSVPDLARAAGVTRTVVHDAESGRRLAGLPLVTALASQAPESASDLLKRIGELQRIRSWRLRRPGAVLARSLTKEFGDGFLPHDVDDLPRPKRPSLPEVLTPVDDTNRCLQLAIDLLEAAVHHPSPSTLVVSRPPVLLTASQRWQQALIKTVAKGWNCVQIVDEYLDQAGQAALIRQGLRFVGLAGGYRIVRSDPQVPIPSFVVAEGVGTLQLFFSATSALDSALYFPSTGSTDYVANAFLDQGRHRLEPTTAPFLTVYETIERSEQRWAAADELIDRPLPVKLRFNRALTEAESRPGARMLVKSGPIVATMPPDVAARQAARWKEHVSEAEWPLIDMLLDDRLRRWNSVHSRTGKVSIDVCTQTAITRYLGPDLPHEHPYHKDPFYSGKFLSRDDRIAHMRSVVDLVRNKSLDYDLGLAESPDHLASPVGDAYWQVADDSLFVLSFYRTERPVDSMPVYLTIGAPEIVAAFRDLGELVWEELTPEGRDQEKVAAWIEQQVDHASNDD